jgi:hypothetical protein
LGTPAPSRGSPGFREPARWLLQRLRAPPRATRVDPKALVTIGLWP